MNIQEAAKTYLEHLQNLGRSPRTLYTYGKDLEQIQAFFGSQKPLTTMTLPLVGKFYRCDELLKLPDGKLRANRTINKTLRVFRNWIFWLQSTGAIETIPLPKETPWKKEASPE